MEYNKSTAKPRCSEAPRSATLTTSTWAIGYVDVNRNIFASEASHLEHVTNLIHVDPCCLCWWSVDASGYNLFGSAEGLPPQRRVCLLWCSFVCLSIDQIPRNWCRRSRHQGIPRCNDTLRNFSSICGFFLHQLTQPWRLEASVAELKSLKKNEVLRTPELSELLHFMPWLRLSAVSAILEGRLFGPFRFRSCDPGEGAINVKRCDDGCRVHPAFKVCASTHYWSVRPKNCIKELQTSISVAFERTPHIA